MPETVPDFIPRKLTFSDIEVAELLGVNERTVRRYKADGRLGGLAAKGAKNRRVTYQGLVAYLSNSDDADF